MLKWLKNMSEWAFLMIYLGLVFVLNILLGLQGFDMFDEGWVLTTYQQLFEHPQSAEYQFLYYNGAFVGALWNLAFAKWGIFGFRVLTGLCRVAIAGSVYGLLKMIVNRWWIMLGTLLAILNPGYILVFHHNELTALLCCMAAFCIFWAISKKKLLWMLIAGVIVGINIFTRLTNVAMLSLILILIPVYIYTKDKKFTWNVFGCAVAGCVIGIVSQLTMMKCLGHLDIFFDSINSGFSAASEEDSTHSLSNLGHVYLSNYKLVIKYGTVLASYPVAMWLIQRLAMPIKWQKVCFLIGCVVYVGLVWYIVKSIYVLYAFCYLVYVAYLCINRENREVVYLIALATIILFFQPFGSDFGIGNMGANCIWIALPLALGLVSKLYHDSQLAEYVRKSIGISILVFCCFSVIKFSYSASQSCYFDYGSRFEKTYKAQAPLANIYTTKENCEITDDLILHLGEYVQEGDYLLSYMGVAMVHYLTHTYPYLNNSWPWTYDAANLEYHFKKAEKDIDVLPIILRNKSVIAGWQYQDYEWDDENSSDQSNFSTKKVKLIHDFQHKYNYYVVWENELFQILKSDMQPQRKDYK